MLLLSYSTSDLPYDNSDLRNIGPTTAVGRMYTLDFVNPNFAGTADIVSM